MLQWSTTKYMLISKLTKLQLTSLPQACCRPFERSTTSGDFSRIWVHNWLSATLREDRVWANFVTFRQGSWRKKKNSSSTTYPIEIIPPLHYKLTLSISLWFARASQKLSTLPDYVFLIGRRSFAQCTKHEAPRVFLMSQALLTTLWVAIFRGSEIIKLKIKNWPFHFLRRKTFDRSYWDVHPSEKRLLCLDMC